MSNDNNKDNITIGDIVKHGGVDAPTDLTEFFAFLDVDMDDYSMVLSRANAIKLKRHLSSLRTGTHAVVPLICPGGKRCPIAMRCPFTEFTLEGKIDFVSSEYPVLRPCPVEKEYMKSKIRYYAQEYEVDPRSASTISLITKLAELDVYDMRCDILLSGGDPDGQGLDLMREDVTTIDPRNDRAYSTLKIHPAWEIKERIQKQRMDILDVLIGTPKAKIRAKKDLASAGMAKQENTIFTAMADLQGRIQDIQSEQAKQGSITVEFEEN